MTADRRVLLLGSGSFARAVAYGLSTRGDTADEVVVAARPSTHLRDICAIATMRATAAGWSRAFTPRETDLDSERELKALLASVQPDLIVNCVSYQSPWEGVVRPSAWTRAMSLGGIAMTLPLQALLVSRVAAAAAAVVPDAPLLNASYPDVVNELLHLQALPVTGGLGNVTVLQYALEARLRQKVRVVGHHIHLHQPTDAADEARAWVGDTPLPSVTASLAAVRALPRTQLGDVAGEAAAALVSVLLDGRELSCSMPGPGGEPGGYPVQVRNGRVQIELTKAALADARAFNQAMSRKEGVAVDPTGRVTFVGNARDALLDVAPELADGFHVRELRDAADRLRAVRRSLRGQTTI